MFKPLLELAGVEWVWLQPDIRSGDRATLDAYPQVTRIGESFADFADTAAVVEQLDLVISVDTSVRASGGRVGPAGVDPDFVSAGLALDARSRRYAVVPQRDAVQAAGFGRLARPGAKRTDRVAGAAAFCIGIGVAIAIAIPAAIVLAR